MEKLSFTLQLSVLVMGLTLTVIPGCQTATAPQAAECGAGFLPCEDNITECCEVICPELHHHCGDFLTECCLDTTSHNFIWEIDTLGGHNSYLNDVAIIDENNIWAVGNIETDSGDYNAAHWDGESWELVKINFAVYYNTDPQFIDNAEITSIFYLEESNTLYFTCLGALTLYRGLTTWDYIEMEPMNGIPGNAIWGSSPEDIWFVGYNGSIVHYDGSGFTRMESGTDVNLKDIDGTPDGEHVFAVGWDNNLPAPSTVLELKNGLWATLYYIEGAGPSEGCVGWVWGVSVLQDTVYLSTEGGLWKFSYLTQESTIIPNNISYMNMSAFKNVHGQSVNDIFFAGSGFKYNHFNGNSFFYSQEITDMYPQRAMMGSDYKNDLAIMVGWFNWWEGALIAKGHHE